jgi:hypothetical protein
MVNKMVNETSSQPFSLIVSNFSMLLQLLNAKSLSFEESLKNKTEDSFKAEIIIQNYKMLLEPFLKERPPLQEAFEKWLIAYSPYMNSPGIENFLEPLLKQAFAPIQANLNEFFQRIRKAFEPQQKKIVQTLSQKVQVVVLTTTRCGFGHFSAADGIKSYLDKHSFSVQLIDRDQVLDCSSIMKEHPKHSMTKIHDDRMTKLRDLIASFAPILILSTASHDWDDAPLVPDLQIPFRLIQTDYAIHPSLTKKPECPCSICLTSSFFDSPATGEGTIKVWLATEKLDSQSEKIKTRIGETKFNKHVESFGFPIRPSFVREQDPMILKKNREELSIGLDHQVILISQGGLGNKNMLDFVQQLNETSETFKDPLHIVIICGRNQEVHKEIQDYLNLGNTKHPQIVFCLEGLVSQEKMAKYAKAACIYNSKPGLMIGKTGGSTTAENFEMGLYTLALTGQDGPNELQNLEYLAKAQLGQALIDSNNIIPEVKAVLEKNDFPSLPSSLDWKQKLSQTLNALIK